VSTFDREALEAERDFLLRSLDDLDDERAAGNVDAGTYRELHDDYTARAAAVIRSLDDGTALAVPEPARASMRRRALTAAGIVAFAIVAAVLLSHAVGQRRPGQTITGNGQVASGSPPTSNPGRTLAAAVQREPRSYAAGPTRQSLLTASLARINDVIKSHPQYPDAHAFKGVILFDFEHNARDAIPSFQRFLLLTDETNPLRAQVLGVLAEAEKAA